MLSLFASLLSRLLRLGPESALFLQKPERRRGDLESVVCLEQRLEREDFACGQA
jgi:hypothetical protein